MFCKNCGNQIPDNSNNCPNCGAPVGASAPQAQPAAPQQNGFGAAANKMAAPLNNIEDKPITSLNIAGNAINITTKTVIALGMVILIIIGMIGLFKFKMVKLKATAFGVSFSEKYSLSDVSDDASLDEGFHKFVKVVEILVLIGAIGGVAGCGYMIFKNKTPKALLCTAASSALLAIGNLFLIIDAFYVKGKAKDSMGGLGSLGGSVKVKGGPVFGVFFWFIVFAALAFVAYTLSTKASDSNSSKPSAPAGFGA
jgi:hypothetical protein